MKKIFLIGDPSIDWLVYYEPNQTPGRSNKLTKNLENNPRAVIHKLPGGVLMLKAFLNQINEPGDDLLTYPDMDMDALIKKVPTHTFAVVKNYDHDHPEIMRVDQFLGYADKPVNKDEKFCPKGDPSDADMIIIDDAGNGVRDEKNHWITALDKNKKQFQIIHKINWPLKENELVKKLVNKFADKMVAIISADDLREHGLEISRQLSWDKTIEDFFKTFPCNKELEDLRNFGTIVIRFNLEATIVMFRVPGTEEKENCDFEYYLFYDPAKYEGQTMDDTDGNMQGLTHAFIAAMVKRLSYPQDKPDKDIEPQDINHFFFLSAIIPGMEAANRFLNRGYDAAKKVSDIKYPLQQLFPIGVKAIKEPEDQNHPKKGQQKSQVQLADITDYLSGPKPHSLLKHLSFNSKDLIASVAFGYVKNCESPFLCKIPSFQTGAFKTYDDEEIESYRSLYKLIKDYLYGSATRPLSIAVFGPPGSGKSFGIKQIAASENFKKKITVIETNLSQLQSYNDLITIFHGARDINLSGKTPLIFFDEFDASYGEKAFGWIKYFLAPMQDGEFKDGEKMHPLGRAVLVFAGGVFTSFDEFVRRTEYEENTDSQADENEDNVNTNDEPVNPPKSSEEKIKDAKALKIPDFVSRLKGFINIKGVDRQQDKEDMFYSLRRALVMRSMLDRDYKNLVGDDKKINIDDQVLIAFLQIDKFKHGVRSLEAIIKMSDLTNERSFKKSNLASNTLLDIHVDTDRFKELMKEDKIFPSELFEPIAQEIHARWYKEEKDKKEKPVKATLKKWNKLDEGTRDSNRGQAIDMLRKLNAFGYTVVKKNTHPKEPVTVFDPSVITDMAKMEHDRWSHEKITNGWTYGKIRNDKLKVHDCLLPWDKLTDENKEKDIKAITDIPGILDSVGFAVVKGEVKQ